MTAQARKDCFIQLYRAPVPFRTWPGRALFVPAASPLSKKIRVNNKLQLTTCGYICIYMHMHILHATLMNTLTNTDKPRKQGRPRKAENPEKLSIRARREFGEGYKELNDVQQVHARILFQNSVNASVAEIERAAHALRIAQATAHLVHALWDLVIDLKKRIPTEQELAEKAAIVQGVYNIEGWNWKDSLRSALQKSRYFASVRDFFPL